MESSYTELYAMKTQKKPIITSIGINLCLTRSGPVGAPGSARRTSASHTAPYTPQTDSIRCSNRGSAWLADIAT